MVICMNTMNNNRYIGVTGFKTTAEIAACSATSLSQEPMMMYGILTTPRMLAEPARAGTRRPARNKLIPLFKTIPRYALATIHHCTDNRQFTQELDQLLLPALYEQNLCDALQINQRLPEVKELAYLRKQYPDLQLILQLEPEDLETPKLTGEKLNAYEGLVDYVIIDPSRGVGKILDRHVTLAMLQEIKIPMTPVIAGGLHAGNVEAAVSFFRSEYGENFSIDAEGRLRDANDVLSLEKMTAYLTAAYGAYRG